MSDCAKSPIFLLMIVKDTICQLDVARTDRFPNSSVPYITTSVWNRHNIIGSYSYITFDRHMMITLPRATRDNNIEVKARVWLPWRERNKYGCGSIATFMTHEWSLFRNLNSILILKSITFVSRVASIHWYNGKLCDEIWVILWPFFCYYKLVWVQHHYRWVIWCISTTGSEVSESINGIHCNVRYWIGGSNYYVTGFGSVNIRGAQLAVTCPVLSGAYPINYFVLFFIFGCCVGNFWSLCILLDLFGCLPSFV